MDLLVTVAEVRARLVLPVHPDVDKAITSSILSAQLEIESQLGLSFTEQTGATDLFHIEVAHYWSSLPHELAPLRLRTGFVKPGSVALHRYPFLEDAMDPSFVGETIASRFYTMSSRDAVLGIVRVNTAYYDESFVRVTYSTSLDITEVPYGDNLKQAIIERATALIATVTPSAETDEAVALDKGSRDNTAHLLRMFNRLAVAFAFDPVD